MDVSSEEVVLQLADSIHHLAVEDESLSQPNNQLDDSVHHLTVEDTSLYQPDSQGSSTETSSGKSPTETHLVGKQDAKYCQSWVT